MGTDMTRIRFQHEKYGKVQGIMSLVNEETLKQVHKRQPREKAKGIDDEDKTSYENKKRLDSVDSLAVTAAFVVFDYIKL